MENITIREYKSADKKQVSALFLSFQKYLVSVDTLGIVLRPKKGYEVKYLEHTLDDVSRNRGKMYVALKDKRVIGLVSAIFLKKDKFSKEGIVGRITELYLEEGHRGSGIGFKLMDKAEKYLKSKKCNRIFIQVFAPNSSALKFYEKLDYVVCDVDMVKEF